MRTEHFRNANLPVRVPRGNEGFWDIMLRLQAAQGGFTVAEIDGETFSSVKRISQYLTALVAAGIAEPIGTKRSEVKGRYPTPVYRLLKQPAKAPRVRKDGSLIPPTVQEQLWTTMRNLKQFSLRDLVFSATTDDVKPKQTTARQFVSILEKAGYLVVVEANPKSWRLKPKMNTGPLPPRVKQLDRDFVWDQNLGAFVGDAPIVTEVTQ